MSDIDIFAKEYLGKVFYFCLKKTGNEQDAAELAGDIGLEVVQAFARGKQPENFDAWLWTLARNRWAKWAAKKYYRPEQFDIGEYEEALASEESLEEDAVHSEELMRIRRELAFIRADYRQILVAHYFEEMSVSEISRRFGIPQGTVKTKLQSSRKVLKEGMNMSRQFGTRSFQPETIYFTASGNQPSGLPWSAVKRKIPVNILCQANNNPCTVEELSMELGIAMPYMEEEVSLLEQAELLRRLDNGRYVTGFFISPRECQSEVNELSCEFAEKHYGDIWELAGRVLERFGQAGRFSGAVSPMDAQAFFAFFIERQLLEYQSLLPGVFTQFKRKDGGNWGFMGREEGASCRLPRMFFDNQWHMGESEEIAPMYLTWCLYSANGSEYGKRLYRENTPSGDAQMSILKRIAGGDAVADFPTAKDVLWKNCWRAASV